MMMNAEGGCQAPSSGPLQLVLRLLLAGRPWRTLRSAALSEAPADATMPPQTAASCSCITPAGTAPLKCGAVTAPRPRAGADEAPA